MGSTGFNGVVVLLGLLLATLALALGGTDAHATPLKAGRSLVEGENSTQSSSRTSSRTERTDPLDSFKKYKGGYDITNKHYWSSTIFTGIYGYSIAVIWLLGGLVFSGFLLVKALCFKHRSKKDTKRLPCTRRCCLWPIPIGAFFTGLAIVASGVVLAGSSRSHSRANSVKNIIEETAERASGTIFNVTTAVKTMQEDTDFSGSFEGSTRLNSTSQKLNDEASRIQRKARKTVRLIGRGLRILQVTTAVIVSLNLVAILVLLASGFLKNQRPFHLLIFLCWLLTFLCWAYFGLYFFLDRFAGDTCVALDEYRQDPRNSSLTSILPCSNHLSARMALRDTRAGMHDLIDQVNVNISTLRSTFPNIAFVCNPFSAPPEYTYQPDSCNTSTIRVGDIPQILKRFECSGSDGGTCGQGEFISTRDYSRVLLYTTSVENILNAFPGVESLVNCRLLKDAFSRILSEQCRPLRRNVRMTWSAMVVLSSVMVFLLVTWVVVAVHDNRSHSSDGSVNPHSAGSASSPEAGTAAEVDVRTQGSKLDP